MRRNYGMVVMALSAVLSGCPALAAEAPAPIVNSVGMSLIGIPAGEYLCYGREIKPVYLFPKPKSFKVAIEKAFHIGAMEVTRKQYQDVMAKKPLPRLRFWRWISGGNGLQAENHPVTGVSWNDAVTFCQRLSERPEEKAAGRVYSLPSEREWQYAARAGSEFLFPYGSDDEMRVAEVAVCRDIYTDSLPAGVQPVGGRKPNAWGLHDVLGNVWEWVRDAWPAGGHPAHVTPSVSAAAWEKGDNRVIVGGGWDNDFRMCNLAARYSAPPLRKANNIGFRVQCVVVGGR